MSITMSLDFEFYDTRYIYEDCEDGEVHHTDCIYVAMMHASTETHGNATDGQFYDYSMHCQLHYDVCSYSQRYNRNIPEVLNLLEEKHFNSFFFDDDMYCLLPCCGDKVQKNVEVS